MRPRHLLRACLVGLFGVLLAGCAKEERKGEHQIDESTVMRLYQGADGPLTPEREAELWSCCGAVELRVADAYPSAQRPALWYDLNLWVPAEAEVRGAVRVRVGGRDHATIAAPLASSGYPIGTRLAVRRSHIDNSVALEPLPAGEHEVELTFELDVRQSGKKGFWARTSRRATARIRVIDGRVEIERVPVADLDGLVTARVFAGRGGEDFGALVVGVTRPAPVALAYSAELVRGTRVEVVGRLAVAPGESPSIIMPLNLPAPPLKAGERLELRLTPAPAEVETDPARFGSRIAAEVINRSVLVESPP
ncbi:MAG TPA: hypothetical protein PK095_07500 [Myxococcota bacterium]|nr:hypothetical protein [Myxococcota bacterium]